MWKASARFVTSPAVPGATVAWAAEPFDPFFNANTIDDLAEAERLAAIEALGTGRNRRI